jgi:hypothetical protein
MGVHGTSTQPLTQTLVGTPTAQASPAQVAEKSDWQSAVTGGGVVVVVVVVVVGDPGGQQMGVQPLTAGGTGGLPMTQLLGYSR